MGAEEAFLAAVAANPADRTARLAYADRLDEQDDARGQLVRIEEEMQTLPATTDRFWVLKPQRNELRAAAGPGWLSRMGYGTDPRPVFWDVPAGWKGRWRLLREFVDRWYGVPLGDVDGRPDVVATAERAAGRPLPPAVREWVTFYTELREHPEGNRAFRDGQGPGVEQLGQAGATSLMVAREWDDIYWAVKDEHLGADDPPVTEYQSYDTGPGEFAEFAEADDRVTGFALRYVTNFWPPDRSSFGVDVPDRAEAVGELAEALPVHARFDGFDCSGPTTFSGSSTSP